MIQNFKEYPFWKMVAASAALFFIVVNIIKFLISLFGGESFSEIIDKASTSDYLISNVMGSIVYGIIISIFYKRKARKLEQKN